MGVGGGGIKQLCGIRRVKPKPKTPPLASGSCRGECGIISIMHIIMYIIEVLGEIIETLFKDIIFSK